MALPFRASAASVLAVMMAGCAIAPGPTDAEQAVINELTSKSLVGASPEAIAAAEAADPITRAAFWDEEYQRNPADRDTALAYARASRAVGQPARAASVANQALALHPGDPALQRVLGAALIEDNRAAAAVEPLREVLRATNGSVDSLTLLGAALDHIGEHAEAQDLYAQALLADPTDLKALTNLGVSLILTGEPEAAERVLRDASSAPGANANTRQNLALALALQGRFAEAEALAQQDQPADAAKENVAYVRALMTRPDRWQALRGLTAGD